MNPKTLPQKRLNFFSGLFQIVIGVPTMTLLTLSGCASYNTLMVSPDGTAVSCDSYGGGLLGMATASHIYDNCIASRRAAGFVEMNKAGAVGLHMHEDSTVILSVAPKGPAELAGLKPGDTIVSVAGQPVKNPKDAGVLLFGAPKTSVEIVASRSGAEQHYTVTRIAWPEVYGDSAINK